MGCLPCFNVLALAERFGCRWFMETGTARGDGLAHVLSLPCFTQCLSVECHTPTARAAKARFAPMPRATIFEGDSPIVLRMILRDPEDWMRAPCFFWLDAHFPGADLGAAAFDAESDPARRWPLQGELDAISGAGRTRDLILIDDLRIYTGQGWNYAECVHASIKDLAQPIGWGAVGEPVPRENDIPAPLNLSAFAATHIADAFMWMEGYVLLTPKA
jgi:hypothetical protein